MRTLKKLRTKQFQRKKRGTRIGKKMAIYVFFSPWRDKQKFTSEKNQMFFKLRRLPFLQSVGKLRRM